MKPSFNFELASSAHGNGNETPGGSARVGKMLLDGVVVETPCCILYTHAGSVPHLTADMVEKLAPNHPLLVSLPSTVSFTKSLKKWQSAAVKDVASEGSRRNIASYSGLPEHPVFLAVQDPLTETPSGFNDKSGVSVWDSSGRFNLNPRSFMESVDAFKPLCFQALCDADTPPDASKKRMHHSSHRSLDLLDECLKINNSGEKSICLASVLGGYSEQWRRFSAEEVIKREGISGYVLDGFHLNGPNVSSLKFEDISSLLKGTLSMLPKDKLRIMWGCFNPSFMYQACLAGVDVFDTSYASYVTDRHIAMIFSLDDVKECKKTLAELNFAQDDALKKDFRPILEGCECYTCKNNFSRAYIHHLTNTSELLGPVLLALHNIHHLMHFFSDIRIFLKK